MKKWFLQGIAAALVIGLACATVPASIARAETPVPVPEQEESIESIEPQLGADMPRMVQFSEDGNQNVGTYVKMAVETLKKQGWKPNAKWGYRYYGYTRGQADHDIALIFSSEEALRAQYDAQQAASKKAGLAGFGYYEAGLAEISLECTTKTMHYSFEFTFKETGKNVKLVGGYIRAYSGTGVYGYALECEPLNTKAATVSKKAQSEAARLEKEMKAVPADKIAALDFMGGIKMDDDVSKEMAGIFQKEGWTKTDFKAFYLPSQDIFSDAEWALAQKASRALRNIQDYGAMNDSGSELYSESLYLYSLYSEKKYKIGDAVYYIDFCVAFEPIVGGKQYQTSTINRLFLVAKPAKANAEGKLDHFFYPADTKSATISADMKDYFNGKTPTRCIGN